MVIKYLPLLKSLVTIRMNEIFPCLNCYGQKFSETQTNTASVKCSGEDETGILFLKKRYLRCVLTSTCL